MAGATNVDNISCTINTEISQTLAAIRRPPDPTTTTGPILPGGIETLNSYNSRFVQSLHSLRSFVFHPLRGSWTSVDPTIYLSPFIDIIQSDDVTDATTAIALRAVRKIIGLHIFGAVTPGAHEAVHAVVDGITNCHIEMTDPAAEEFVLLRVLQLLKALVQCKPSFVLLTHNDICTIVSTSYQIVQQAVFFSDVLHNSAKEAMQGIIECVYSRLEDLEGEKNGVQSMIDVFYFLVSLVNVEEKGESEGGDLSWVEEEQLFVLWMINSVVEIGGDSLNRYGGILSVIQDDLFRHLMYYGTRSGLRIFSLICDIVFNLYHFARR